MADVGQSAGLRERIGLRRDHQDAKRLRRTGRHPLPSLSPHTRTRCTVPPCQLDRTCHNVEMPRPPTGERSAPRDILELRALATRQPDLTTAAALHAELVTAVRRVESRVTTPSLDMPLDLLQTRLARGVPLASFGEFPVDWAEVAADPADHRCLPAARRHRPECGGQAARCRPRRRPVGARAAVVRPAADARQDAADDPDPMWPEALQWALKPFLIRTAEVLTRRVISSTGGGDIARCAPRSPTSAR